MPKEFAAPAICYKYVKSMEFHVYLIFSAEHEHERERYVMFLRYVQSTRMFE
jgi:hypothetical protein